MPMVSQITKSFIENTPNPEKGQVVYCDNKLTGFGMVFGMKAKTFIAQKDIFGRTARYTIGRYGHFTAEEARKIAHDKLYLMAQNINPNKVEQQERGATITLRASLKSYCEVRKSLTERSKSDYNYYAERYLHDWLHLLMTDIDKDMILARHAYIGETHGKPTANKVMRLLRALFNHAEASFGICEINPVTYLSRTKAWYPEKRRTTYIKPHQLKTWWEAVHRLENETMRDFLLLLLFTGMRRSECAQIMWKDIDFEDCTFQVQNTKNGDPLVLPMSDYVFSLLERRFQRYGNNLYVFPGPGRKGYLAEPKKAVYKVIELSGIPFSPHDLRRTYITYAEALDLPYYALKKLLNHGTQDITASYIVTSAERLRKPMQKITDFILEKVNESEKA